MLDAVTASMMPTINALFIVLVLTRMAEFVCSGIEVIGCQVSVGIAD
jgi:hypothetical protein